MTPSNAPDLGTIPPFAGLPGSARQYLQARLQKYDLPAGLTLVRPGQRGQFMAIIEQGQVALSGVQGGKQLLGIGESFGEGMMRYGVPSSFTAVTRSASCLWVIQRKDWVFAGELPPDPLSPAAQQPPAPTQKKQEPGAGTKARPARPADSSKPRRNRPAWRRLAWMAAILALLVAGALILSPELPRFASQEVTRRALQAGRPDLAQTYLETSQQWQPDQAALYDALGSALYQEGQQLPALDAFSKAVAQDAELASAQNNLGVLLLNQEQVQEALEHLQMAAELNPGNAAVYYNLGNAWLAAGDLEKAGAAYRRASELDVGQIDALAAWAGIALQQGQTEAARLAWEQVLAVRPDHFIALRGLGALTLLQGLPEQALPYLLAARIANPQDAANCFYLGMALEALGRPAEAAESFELALAYSDNPALSEMALAHLRGMQR